MRNTNPFLSALNLIPLGYNIELCFTRELPCAIAFTTNIGKQDVLNHECAEIFIDSTYKTNNSKFELSVIMASVLGTGIPLAYMFLQPGTQILWTQDTTGCVIEEFLRVLKEKLMVLRPKFFFTDKDMGQLSPIRNIFDVTPSICFWHMKRAVRKKILAIIR